MLLDAVVRYLPNPTEREIKARVFGDDSKRFDLNPIQVSRLLVWPSRSSKIPLGQLTFMRIYQGKISKGEMYTNQRTGRKERFSRIVKMHADKREEIDSAEAGDIVAIMGIDCAAVKPTRTNANIARSRACTCLNRSSRSR